MIDAPWNDPNMPSADGSSRARLKRKLLGWALAVAVLGVLGINAESQLKEANLVVPGTEYARVFAKYKQEFGRRVPLGIMLQGPARELDRQGPRVVQALRNDAGARVLSPWDRASGNELLRPRRDSALIVAEFEARNGTFDWMLPKAKEIVGRTTTGSVVAHYTGFVVFAQGLKEESIKAATRAELLAFPILIIVLLLVFRSPIAASIPLVIGGATVVAGRGVLTLAAGMVDIDATAASLESMMGLALGVDYALLVVSRFREEIRGGASGEEAARVAAATAGRTVAFAGITLMASMAIVMTIAPGSVLLSMFVGVFVAAALGVCIAVFAIPSLLALVGARIERWRLPQRRTQNRWVAFAGQAMRRPAVAVPLIVASLLVMAAPVSAIQTGPPDVRQLPADSKIRRDAELVNRVMGPGWAASYEIVVSKNQGPITDAKTLSAIARWQRRVSRIADVADVIGPGSLAKSARDAQGIPKQLDKTRATLKRGGSALSKLNTQLSRAGSGLRQITAGLTSASIAAGEIERGDATAGHGVDRLRAGLAAAATGSQRLSAGIAAAKDGARRLVAGSASATSASLKLANGLSRIRRAVESQALPGARRLATGLGSGASQLDRLREPARSAEGDLAQAIQRLKDMTVGKADPQYVALALAVGRASAAVSGRDPRTGQPVAPGYDGLDVELQRAVAGLIHARDGANRLADGSQRLVTKLALVERGAGKLASGMQRLDRGNAALAAGLARLSAGGSQLQNGLRRIAVPVGQLRVGLRQLQNGAAKLRDGLRSGSEQSRPLEAGISGAGKPLQGFRTQILSAGQPLNQLQQRSPRIFESGDFVLAGLDGARPAARNRAASGISLDRGGQAARVVVIPKTGPNDQRTQTLGRTLDRAKLSLEKETGADVGVGGGAAELAAYHEATTSRFPLIVVALALATWVVLIVIFRSLLLALVAVVLNLLTVGASFGLLTLLFQGPGLPLGGPGFLDAIMITGIFTVTFGLSIDYEVFLLMRMREGHLARLDNRAAMKFCIENTAHVITGAALIMTAVFASFAVAGTGQLRQLGVGLVIAVVLDATIVRLLLLPAVITMLGRWCWWLPPWLDRVLPHLDVEREKVATRPPGSPVH